MADPLAIIRFMAMEYPRLCRRLILLAESVKNDSDRCLAAVILFGSTARLMAAPGSDADLLVLMETNGNRYLEHELSHHIYHLIEEAEIASHNEAAIWQIVPITGDINGVDLEADFLAEVGRDGILLHPRPDIALPLPLRHLTSFAIWQEQVTTLVSALEHVPAISKKAATTEANSQPFKGQRHSSRSIRKPA